MNKWISVKDKMPPENEDVLAFVRAGDSSWYEIMYRMNGDWWRQNGHRCIHNVPCWMVILEPPKIEEDAP